jgi:hypothetical protein
MAKAKSASLVDRPSTPVENFLGITLYQELIPVYKAQRAAGLIPVKFHQTKLGKQSFTWQGSDCRLFIWETDLYRLFVGNGKGAYLEVYEPGSKLTARKAMNVYLKEMLT